ncbi:MAG: homoserine dehydrogenase [Symbiobacteriaceae bacterium]|nr:homoserine dehydrogenase [Symbiobacteriaceae bacterium]
MRQHRLVLVGFGNIARHLVQVIASKEPFLAKQHHLKLEVAGVVDIQGAALVPPQESIPLSLLSEVVAAKKDISALPWFRPGCSAEEALREVQADIMVELTPTNPKDGSPALQYMLQAFQAGMHVVTANKGPLVVAYRQLTTAAATAGKMLKFGCATAAALPTTNVGYYDLAGCEILEVSGILNGTSNYILTRMHQDALPYTEALAQAQAMGIAEKDPTLDVDGIDTAIKLVILANALWDANLTLEHVQVKGIRQLTPQEIEAALMQEMVYKLVGKASWRENLAGERQVTVEVAPALLDSSNPLYKVDGTAKAVAFATDLMGTLLVTGGNSSPVGAAAAILRDLVNLSREGG